MTPTRYFTSDEDITVSSLVLGLQSQSAGSTPEFELLAVLFRYVGPILRVIADHLAAVVQIVEWPVAVGDAEDDLELDSGMSDRLLENADSVAVA